MIKSKIATLISLCILASFVNASEYSVRIPFKDRMVVGSKQETYSDYTSLYGEWTNSGTATGCTWTPSAASYDTSESFTQNGTGCSQTQTRTVQPQEISSTTQIVRAKGQTTTETRTITTTATRTTNGTSECRYQGANPYYEAYLGGSVSNNQVFHQIFLTWNGVTLTQATKAGPYSNVTSTTYYESSTGYTYSVGKVYQITDYTSASGNYSIGHFYMCRKK